MIKHGLKEEVTGLKSHFATSKVMQTAIGYKELFEYFDGKVTLEQALYNIKKNSRHYAKRQYTFFNNKLDVTWFNTNYEDFSKTVLEVKNYIDGVYSK